MKPISTIIREVLIEFDVWEPGCSKTFQDTSYTKQFAKKSWHSKYLYEITDDLGKKIKKKIKQRLSAEGHKFDEIHVSDYYGVAVYQKTPIRIVQLDT